MSPPLFTFATAIALIAIFCTACFADHCKDHVLGFTGFTYQKHLPRVYLEPYNEMATFSVPTECKITQAVGAHACAPDAAPFVNVTSFQEVVVQRDGAPYTFISVDITAYCSILERSYIEAST